MRPSEHLTPESATAILGMEGDSRLDPYFPQLFLRPLSYTLARFDRPMFQCPVYSTLDRRRCVLRVELVRQHPNEGVDRRMREMMVVDLDSEEELSDPNERVRADDVRLRVYQHYAEFRRFGPTESTRNGRDARG